MAADDPSRPAGRFPIAAVCALGVALIGFGLLYVSLIDYAPPRPISSEQQQTLHTTARWLIAASGVLGIAAGFRTGRWNRAIGWNLAYVDAIVLAVLWWMR